MKKTLKNSSQEEDDPWMEELILTDDERAALQELEKCWYVEMNSSTIRASTSSQVLHLTFVAQVSSKCRDKARTTHKQTQKLQHYQAVDRIIEKLS